MKFLFLTSTRPLQPNAPAAPGTARTARGRPRSRRSGSPLRCLATPKETSRDQSGMVTMTRTRLIPVIGIFTRACILVRAASGPTVSTDAERPAAGPRTHPTTSPAAPTGSTPTSTQAPPGPGPAADHGSVTGRPGTACVERGHHGAFGLVSSCASSQCPGPEPCRSGAEARGCGLRHRGTPLGWKLHHAERDHAAGATGPGQRPAVLLCRPIMRPAVAGTITGMSGNE